MCAITGLFSPGHDLHLREVTAGRVARLLFDSQSRGRDGFGVAFLGGEWPEVKIELPCGKPLVFEFYQTLLQRMPAGTQAMIANHRAEPSTEFVARKREADQQPYTYDNMWAVHNGTVSNDKKILGDLRILPPTQVDSYAIPVACRCYGIRRALLKELMGSFAVLVWDGFKKELVAYRNYRPLNILYLPLEQVFVFSSLSNLKIYFPEGVEIPFPPYSFASGFTATGGMEGAAFIPNNRERALVVCSGGLDSVTTAAVAKRENQKVDLLHFKYGCMAEAKEVEAVQRVASELNCDVHFVDMGWLKKLGGSALTEEGPIASGVAGAEFPHEWVPARNAAMIGIAASYADRYNCGRIYLGLNIEEAGAYADNTVEFFEEFNHVLNVGTQARPQVCCPVALLTKREIVKLAYEIGAPIHLAWSCYRGGGVHCGVCGPCHMRRTAHKMLGIEDTVLYAQ